MVRVTLKLPDNTARLAYALANEDGYTTKDKPVTADMIVEAEREGEPDERE